MRLVTKHRPLVGCAFGDDDEVHPAVFLLHALFMRGFAAAGGDARGVNALLAEILLGEFGAGGSQLGSPRFTRIREANNDQLGVRIALESQGHVVAHALASIVEARSSNLGVAAVADLGRLWRRGRFLNVYGGGGAGASTLSVVCRAVDGITAGGEAGGVELGSRVGAGNLPGASRVAIGQRISVRIAGRGNNGHAFAGDNRIALWSAGNGRR